MLFDIRIPETQDPRPTELRVGESKLKKNHLVSEDGGEITTRLKSVVNVGRHRKERCRDTLLRQVGWGTGNPFVVKPLSNYGKGLHVTEITK
jgi:hypothetical protein